MADLLATGFGTVGGSRASPVTLLGKTTETAGLNFVTFQNLASATGPWLFAKEQGDPGAYCVARPQEYITLAYGPQSANNAKEIIGFGANVSGTTETDGDVLVRLASKKLA